MALTLLISIVLLALCITGMAIGILLKKNGEFPITEIGANPNMRKLGLRCAQEEFCGKRCGTCSDNSPLNKNVQQLPAAGSEFFCGN